MIYKFILRQHLICVICVMVLSSCDSKIPLEDDILGEAAKECIAVIGEKKSDDVFSLNDEASQAVEMVFRHLEGLDEHSWERKRTDVSYIIQTTLTPKANTRKYTDCFSFDGSGNLIAEYSNYGPQLSMIHRIGKNNHFRVTSKSSRNGSDDVMIYESILEADTSSNKVYRTMTKPAHFNRGKELYALYKTNSSGAIIEMNIVNTVYFINENGGLLVSGGKWCEIEEDCEITEKEYYHRDINNNLRMTRTFREGKEYTDNFGYDENSRNDWEKRWISKSTHEEPYGYAEGFTFIRHIIYADR